MRVPASLGVRPGSSPGSHRRRLAASTAAGADPTQGGRAKRPRCRARNGHLSKMGFQKKEQRRVARARVMRDVRTLA